MADLETNPPNPSTLFRPSKRRKVVRARAPSSSPPPDSPPPLSPHAALPDADPDAPSISSVLRARKPKPRKAGIEFSNAALARPASTALVGLAPHGGVEAADYAASRFAPQTGLVAENLDKHMMAYVDSKLAELRTGSTGPGPANANAVDTRFYRPVESAGQIVPVARQPVGAGKLMEIDLGPSATLMNIARTEAATRRMQGIAEPPAPAPASTGRGRGGKTKAALGPDGKPWRGRRNRRTDEDLKRDRLVEQVLSESKLDIYDAAAAAAGEESGAAGAGAGDDVAADDRLAEQFKQEFLDAQMARNARRTNGPPATKTGEERPKGPKLGGSRSARAAMHKAMEEAAKKK